MPPLTIYEDENDTVSTQGRKAPVKMLRELDANVIIPSRETRKTTRQTIHGRSHALYDQRYHPMDDHLCKNVPKRVGGKRKRSLTLEDGDSASDAEEGPVAMSEPKGERKSSRIAAQATRPLYSRNIHPQDKELRIISALKRRPKSKLNGHTKRRRVISIDSDPPENDLEDFPMDDAAPNIESNRHSLHPQSPITNEIEKRSDRYISPQLLVYERSTLVAMSPQGSRTFQLVPLV
jgi:hypothetical protein